MDYTRGLLMMVFRLGYRVAEARYKQGGAFATNDEIDAEGVWHTGTILKQTAEVIELATVVEFPKPTLIK